MKIVNSKQYIVISKIFLLSTIYFLLTTTAQAAIVSLSPTVISVSPGQVITVNITVDPQGQAYTAKVALNFTPGLLAVSSFTQASGWLPLSQPGYDSVDNSSGSLIKTAGATGGFSAPQIFGTVTLVANSSGIANITVSPATQVLNNYNQNTFTGGNQVTVNVSTPAPIPKPTPTPNPARNLLQKPVATSIVSTSSESDLMATSASQSLPAQASRTFDLPWNILIPVLTFILGFALGNLFAKRDNSL